MTEYNKKWFDTYLPHYEWNEIWLVYAQNIINFFKPDSAYEVGCAKGCLIKALNKLGIKTKGSDISEYAIKNTVDPNCYVANATSLPEKDNSYDLVLAIDLVEHLAGEDQQKAIDEMIRITNRYILIRTPMYNIQDIYDQQDVGHIGCKPIWEWIKIFTERGFILIGIPKWSWTNINIKDGSTYNGDNYPFGFDTLAFELPDKKGFLK